MSESIRVRSPISEMNSLHVSSKSNPTVADKKLHAWMLEVLTATVAGDDRVVVFEPLKKDIGAWVTTNL